MRFSSAALVIFALVASSFAAPLVSHLTPVLRPFILSQVDQAIVERATLEARIFPLNR